MEYINKLFKAKRNLKRFTVLAPLGFDNSYQLIVRRRRAEELQLSSGPTISELALKSKDLQPPLIFASTADFFYRRDGWPGLRKTYKLQTRSGYAAHDEKYGRLAKGTADVVDAYTTDPELRDTTQRVFVTLKDDQNLFPRYYAAALTTNQLLDADIFAHVRVRESLSRLEKKISEKDITDLIATAAKLGVNSGDLRYVETSRARLEGMVKELLIQKKILPGPGAAPAQSRPVAQSPR